MNQEVIRTSHIRFVFIILLLLMLAIVIATTIGGTAVAEATVSEIAWHYSSVNYPVIQFANFWAG